MTFSAKTFFLLACVFAGSFSAVSAEVLYPVRVRNERRAIEVRNLSIPGLKQEGVAETDHFKVVFKTGDEAVALDASEDGQRAANLLYHLEYAYQRLGAFAGLPALQSLGQIKVRLQIQNQFSEVVHFVSEDLKPMFNNITSIPPSNEERLSEYPEWKNEIWVRPVRSVSEYTALKSFDDQSKVMRKVMIEGTVTSVTTQYAQFSSAYNRLLDPSLHLEQLGVGLAISIGLPEFMGWVGKKARKKVEFDAAMVPEVIYHEFAHLAFSQWLPIGLSTPVTEGYANYIAIDLSGLNEVAGNLGQYGKNVNATNGKGAAQYQLLHENADYAWEDFTPKLLVAVRDAFGATRGNAVIMESIRVLFRSRVPVAEINIKDDLCKALKAGVRKASPYEERTVDLLKMNEVFRQFGLIRKQGE